MASETDRNVASPKALSRAHSVQLETRARVEFKDITGLVQKYVTESGVQDGVCHLFVPHTTAGLVITENDDPALQKDLDNFLRELAPRDQAYPHSDGNCDAHLKTAIVGCSKTLLVERGRLILGTWQGVYFCEFDGPRRRDLRIKIVPD